MPNRTPPEPEPEELPPEEDAEYNAECKLRSSRAAAKAIGSIVSALSSVGSDVQRKLTNLKSEDRCVRKALADEDPLARGLVNSVVEVCVGVGAGLVNLAALLTVALQTPLEDLERSARADWRRRQDSLALLRSRHTSCSMALAESLRKKEKASGKLQAVITSEERSWFSKPTPSAPSSKMQAAMAAQTDAVEAYACCVEELELLTRRTQAEVDELCVVLGYVDVAVRQTLSAALERCGGALEALGLTAARKLRLRAAKVRPAEPPLDAAPLPEWVTRHASSASRADVPKPEAARFHPAARGAAEASAEAGANDSDADLCDGQETPARGEELDDETPVQAALSDVTGKTTDVGDADSIPGPYAIGEVAEVKGMLDGQAEGTWLPCRVVGRGRESGTFNVYLLAQPGRGDDPKLFVEPYQVNISPVHLRKADDTGPLAADDIVRRRGVVEAAPTFEAGEQAEVIILDGERAGTWLPCRVEGPGTEPGSFDIEVLPTSGFQSCRAASISCEHLRKAPSDRAAAPSTCCDRSDVAAASSGSEEAAMRLGHGEEVDRSQDDEEEQEKQVKGAVPVPDKEEELEQAKQVDDALPVPAEPIDEAEARALPKEARADTLAEQDPRDRVRIDPPL